MIKKALVVLIFMTCFLIAEEANTPWNGKIDDFENGNITEKPAWWTFGNSEQKVVESDVFSKDPLFKYLGRYVLEVKGNAKDWYVGGMGCYLGVDATPFTHVKLYVYGTGPDSGKLTLQLYDDDNGNYQLEQDVNKNYEPINDDRFEYSANINWKGWKVLLIPISSFKDTNKTVGDNTWNPDHKNGSGGLLHFQFIFLANTKTGSVNFSIDNIKLIDMRGKKGDSDEK
ncbi:MAG: hypothetical protein PHV30_03935 [Candidatus Margulisbacteria bacterium]|nr:hypothetical protein [Candidatus Margulisiibacteriota bacterium]